MKKTKFMTSMSRSLHKAGFQLKKHSPEILIVAGVVGAVTSTVMACKATLKVNEVLDKAKQDINNIHDVAADVEAGIRPAHEYTPEDQKKDLTIVYTKTGFELVKLYAPAVIVGTLSIVGIVSSHRILKKRNVALAAAYATIDKGFKEYRGRVIERFGKELDRELKYNIRAKEVEEKVIDENGNETIVSKTVDVADPNLTSDYARFFDETCPGWEKDPEYNLRFLKLQQAYANEKLKCQGHLFLNEVYDMLGLQRSQAGNIVGWIYDEKHPVGDNFVDFGIYDLYNERKRAFVNGYERSILLDFNVDGDIWSLMK